MVKQKYSNETKSDKFKRIASARTRKVLYMLKLLGNCSNKSTYKYDDREIAVIFNTIEKEVKRTRMLYDKSDSNNFKL